MLWLCLTQDTVMLWLCGTLDTVMLWLCETGHGDVVVV